jgi:hypothetical protein
MNLGDGHVIVSFDMQRDMTDSERIMRILSILARLEAEQDSIIRSALIQGAQQLLREIDPPALCCAQPTL